MTHDPKEIFVTVDTMNAAIVEVEAKFRHHWIARASIHLMGRDGPDDDWELHWIKWNGKYHICVRHLREGKEADPQLLSKCSIMVRKDALMHLDALWAACESAQKELEVGLQNAIVNASNFLTKIGKEP